MRSLWWLQGGAMLERYVMVTCAVMSASLMGAARSERLQSDSAVACKTVGAVMRLDGLSEASGVAASRVTPGRLWVHNDSGKAEIVALDQKGTATARVSVSGAAIQDWEAIASGPCEGRNCLFIADIGDNNAKRKDVTVYRVPEPANPGGSVPVDKVFRASYPDGAHDAEALLAAGDGTLYIVTKGETGHVGLYRFPREVRAGTTARLELVGALSKSQKADARITDGAISRDGEWVVLRTFSALHFYRANQFLNGDFREVRRADLKALGEPQGEGVSFAPGAGTVYLAGEGGGKSQPGTLAVLSCAL